MANVSHSPLSHVAKFERFWKDLGLADTEFCIYVMWDEKPSPLYVGATTSLKNRIANHYRYKEWIGAVAEIEVFDRLSRGEAMRLEQELLLELQPRYNRGAIRLGSAARYSRPRSGEASGRPVNGAYIRHLRDALGLNREAFAQQCGLSPSTITALERHRHGATTPTLERLSDVLGVPIDELVASST